MVCESISSAPAAYLSGQSSLKHFLHSFSC